MDISIAISLGALCVSALSLIVTIHFNLKESATIEARSVIFRGDGEVEPTITVTAVNSGRRPTVLRSLVGVDDQKRWVGLNLGEDYQGVRLDEKERFEKCLRNSDLGFFCDDEQIEFTELYFEDSVGRRHRVVDSRKHIREFWVAHKQFRDAQERRRELHSIVASQVRAALKEADGD